MSSRTAAMDPSYSTLFTAGLLNCSAPRYSHDLPYTAPPRETSGLGERRRSPPPPPLNLGTPSRTPVHGFSVRKTPRTGLSLSDARKRRSSGSPAYGVLKSPTRTEMRSREIQIQTKANSNRRSGEIEASGGDREKESMRNRAGGAWSAPVAAISRLHRRNISSSAPSPPPSKPLPAVPSSSPERQLPFSPKPISLKGALTHSRNTSSDRRPLSPIQVPAPPMKSFFSMDEDEEIM